MAPNRKPTAPAKGAKANTSKSSTKKEPEESSGPAKLKPATAINVRHILCEKQSTLQLALSHLQSGVSFATVARDLSVDKARQGGSLGWKVRGSLDPVFEKAAYGVEVSTPGRPKWVEVRTGEGWHLVMVEGRR